MASMINAIFHFKLRELEAEERMNGPFIAAHEILAHYYKRESEPDHVCVGLFVRDSTLLPFRLFKS